MKQKVAMWQNPMALLFIAGVVLVFYKCRFGFADIDEAFYLTIPYRLTMGDGLFAEEWHLSQMAGFLLYPLMGWYRQLFPTTQGMLLHFRYIFTLVHVVVTGLLVYCLRRYKGAAWASGIVYLLFVPYGIMALSYNSMGVAFVTLSAGLIIAAKKFCKWNWYIVGLCFAAAVICCPYLSAVYFLYVAVTLIVWLMYKKSGTKLLWMVLFATMGCATLALCFGLFVLSRTSLKQIILSFPAILNDPEHPAIGWGQTLYDYLYGIWNSNQWAPYVLGIGTVLAVVILLDRKPGSRKYCYGAIALLLTIVYLLGFVESRPYLNFYMFPVAYLGLFAFLFEPKENLSCFLTFWLLGVLYGFCVNGTSNQGFYAVSMAACVSAVGSCIMIYNWVHCWAESVEKQKVKTGLWVTATLLFVSFTVVEGGERYRFLFWETGTIQEMTYQIEMGAEKGILTTAERKREYEDLYRDTQEVRDFEKGPVLYFTSKTYLYLDDAKENAAFSAWLSGTGTTSAERLLRYYELNPHKVPSIAYCLKQDEGVLDMVLPETDYLKKNTELGVIYTKKK